MEGEHIMADKALLGRSSFRRGDQKEGSRIQWDGMGTFGIHLADLAVFFRRFDMS